MTRQQRFPDTATFKYYNANPKNRINGDCVARAVCTAMETSWEDTVLDMTRICLKKGLVFNDPEAIAHYMKTVGWIKHPQPRKADNTKYTGSEFCRWLDSNWTGSNIVANIGGHHTVCISKVGSHWRVMDIWNSTDGCIGNWYSK